MRNFLLFFTVVQWSSCNIPFWPPQSLNMLLPAGDAVMSAPVPPIPSVESVPLYSLGNSVPLYSNYNQQLLSNSFIARNPENPPSESPWMSVVKTVASVMNNGIDWEREKSYLNKAYQSAHKAEEIPQTSYVGSWNEDRLPKQEEIRFEYDPVLFRNGASNFARLVNSIPAPSLLFRIADIMQSSHTGIGSRAEEFESTGRSTTDYASFPVEKDAPSEAVDDGNIIGLVTTGRWKNIDWTRKILGIDEIPTKEEGNAIAQLLDDDSKAGKQ